MAVVYMHKRKDTLEPFYIGIGQKLQRAYTTNKRNKYWHNIVNKHGYEVEILYENVSWSLAKEIETILIYGYGRKDMGTGTLCNLTDGGDGSVNFKHTPESIKLIKECARKQFSTKESRDKVREMNVIRFSDQNERGKISNSMTEKWKDVEYRENQLSLIKNSYTEEVRGKMSEMAKERFKDPEYAKRNIDTVKATWEKEEFRYKWSKGFNDKRVSEVEELVIKMDSCNDKVLWREMDIRVKFLRNKIKKFEERFRSCL